MLNCERISQFKQQIEDQPNPVVVMKFGGTSVGSAKAIGRTCEIVRHYRGQHNSIVVVSAVRGVTDNLVRLCHLIEQKNESEVELVLEDVIVSHDKVIEDLDLSGPLRQSLNDRFTNIVSGLIKKCLPLRPLSRELSDGILSFGERLSAPIVTQALQNQGINAQSVEASEIIETDNSYGNAVPNMDTTRIFAQRRLKGMIEAGVIPVVTGFIGATKDYKVTTLGRGGSDYTAAILGAVLPADQVWIWTDVDGVFDKDPNKFGDAKVLPRLTQSEANEMALNGAKVLYPKTIQPLMGLPIPIWVKNTFNPDFPGTLIIG